MGVFKGESGFTLIELVLVVAVIGILASISIPRYNNVKNKADLTVIKIDLRSIQTYLEIYALENENEYPLQTEFEDLNFVKKDNFVYKKNEEKYLVYYYIPINDQYYYIKNDEGDINSSEKIPDI
ncbi:MAG: type IV pilin protein [Bacillota bacterium]